MKNNAASVWNRTSRSVRVYFNSNFAGASQVFAAGAMANLNAMLKNNNASYELVSGPTGCTTDGTNSKLPSTSSSTGSVSGVSTGSTSRRTSRTSSRTSG